MNGKIFSQDNTGKISVLQGARFFFALLIFFSHCPLPHTTQPFDFGGELGVSFFFILSGFVMSWGYGPRVSRGEFSVRKFFWRHFWKLYPLHLLLIAIVFMLDWRIGNRYDWAQLLSTLFLVQSWIPSNHTLYAVNGVSWFLCDILFFYLIFKFLYSYLIQVKASRLLWQVILFVAVYLAIGFQVPHDQINCTLYVNPLLRAFDFALGIIAYRFYRSSAVSRINLLEKKPYIMLSGNILAGVLTYVIYQMLDGNGIRCAALFWPIVPVCVVCLVAMDNTKDMLVRLFLSAPMRWLGSISFEFFMVHCIVIRISRHFINVGESVVGDYLFFISSLGVSIFAAWILHRWFVNPISKKIG